MPFEVNQIKVLDFRNF